MVAEKLTTMTTADNPFAIVDAHTIEKPFGWVFFYNSKKFLETGQFSDSLAGNGPIIVNKNDATIELCGTAQPVSELIERYERKLTNN